MGGEMWHDIWEWILNNYIYNTAVVIAVISIIVNALKRINPVLQRFLSRYKKIKVGATGFELESKEEINTEKDKQQDNILVSIKNELRTINSRLDKQYEYIKEAALKSNAALVFANKVPPVEFYDAAFMSIYLGANGHIVSRVKEKNMEEKGNLSIYKSELAKFRKEHRIVSEEFKASIKEIYDEWH
jgi:Sec-independent protein translocase protein TatA